MKSSKLVKKLLFLAVILVLLFVGVKSYWNYLLSPVDSTQAETKRFIVYKGESVTSIADRLQKEGFIRSNTAFALLTKRSSTPVQAGDFQLSPAMNSREVLNELSVGVVDRWITLLEGWRIEEMGEEINSKFKTQNSKFLKVAQEGYMFPDTYLFNPESDISLLAQKMRDNFNKKYDQNLQAKVKALGLTPEEGVILASIVEREARSAEPKRMVASILLKRLKIGMGLNADATIQYALVSKGAQNPPAGGWWKRHLSKEDLKIDSPYNTYLYAGLPPAPIANPGLVSLQAVANADPSTPYLYYYHDSKGVSHYGRTLEEHNANIAKYP